MCDSTRIAIALAVLVLLAGTAASCRRSPEPTASPGPPTRVVLADGTQPVSATVYVALAKGYFRREGLDVILQPHTSGKSALQAVIEGRADLATTAETPVMHAAMTGADVCVVATICRTGRSIRIVARRDRGILEPGDLKGKRIGVTAGTNGEFFLDIFLVYKKVPKQHVEIVDLRPEEMLDALVQGRVDAVSTWAPHTTRMEKELGDKGVTFCEERLYTWFWNLAGRRTFVVDRSPLVRKVLRATLEASVFVMENPVEVRRLVATNIQMDEEAVRDAWQGLDFTVSLPQSLLTTLEDQARWLQAKRGETGGAAPDYLEHVCLDGLVAVKPEAVSIIR